MKGIILIVIALLIAVLAPNAFCLQEFSEEFPVEVNGDKVEYFTEEEKIVAEGNVDITYGTSVLRCDKIVLFTKTGDGFAEGNVSLEDEKGLIQGSSFYYNFNSEKGTMADVDLKAPPYFCTSPKADKFPTKFILHDADITTCNFDIPHYHFHAREIEIFPKEKVYARGVKFYIGKIQTLYLPFYIHYLKDRRNGLSISPGRSKEWGQFFLSAYRYYLTDNVRGLLRLDWREFKGLGYGFDLETLSEKFGNGHLEVYYVREDLHGTGEVEPIFKDPDRYKVEYRHKWNNDEGSQLVLEYHKFSDANFLKNYFYRQYEIDSAPDSYALLSHSYPNATLSLLLQKRLNHFFSETEKVPEIKLTTVKQQIGDSQLYFLDESSIAGLTMRTAYVDTDEDTVRADTYNQLSLSKKLGFFSIEPYAGFRTTYYSKDKGGTEGVLRNAFYTGHGISTNFYRIFDDIRVNSWGIDITKIRHIITPSLSYAYIHEPTVSSERLTAFDGIDSIAKSNSMTFSLENKLQTKRKDVSIDFLRLIISSPYTFHLADHGSRFGDITFDLEALPNERFRYESDANFDLRLHKFSTANFDVTYTFPDNGSIGAGYRYSRASSRLVSFSFERVLNPKWKFRSYQRVECYKGTQIEEQEYSLVRDLHCWEVEYSVNSKRKKGVTFWWVFRCKAFPLEFDFTKSHQQPKQPKS